MPPVHRPDLCAVPACSYARGMSPQLLAAGRRRYVSLTTFRRSGAGVATPVWVAPHGDALVVMTEARTFKVKRARRDPRALLQECDARGRVRLGAPTVSGRVELVEDEPGIREAMASLAAKYRWQFRLVVLIERIAARGAAPDRIVLRIRDA